MIVQFDRPAAVFAYQIGTFCAHANLTPSGGGIHSVEHHEACVLHPAIRVLEGMGELGLQGLTGRVLRELQAVGLWQQLAPAYVIVEKQPEANQPSRPQVTMVRQDEAQRPDDVGSGPQQNLALLQRMAHEHEIIVFEVAQTTVNQLGAGR